MSSITKPLKMVSCRRSGGRIRIDYHVKVYMGNQTDILNDMGLFGPGGDLLTDVWMHSAVTATSVNYSITGCIQLYKCSVKLPSARTDHAECVAVPKEQSLDHNRNRSDQCLCSEVKLNLWPDSFLLEIFPNRLQPVQLYYDIMITKYENIIRNIGFISKPMYFTILSLHIHNAVEFYLSLRQQIKNIHQIGLQSYPEMGIKRGEKFLARLLSVAVLMAKEKTGSVQDRCYSPSFNLSGRSRPWRPRRTSRVRKLDGRLTLVIFASFPCRQTFGVSCVPHTINITRKDEAWVHRSVFPGGVRVVRLSRDFYWSFVCLWHSHVCTGCCNAEESSAARRRTCESRMDHWQTEKRLRISFFICDKWKTKWFISFSVCTCFNDS